MLSDLHRMNDSTIPELDLNGLNDAQREAVEYTEGALLVLAGAGTGKTRVLTTRIAHILSRGLAFPGQILAVTFTNKAAREMQVRVAELTGGQAAGIWLGTFHSIGLRLLRRHAEAIGFPSDFNVIDADDQVRLLKQIMTEQGIDTKKTNPKGVAAIIQRWKDRAWTPDEVKEHDSLGKKLYNLYQHRLETLHIMDFGDLLMRCVTLFTKHPEILAEYHRRFRYILVDEYQDTNVAQYLFLRLLAQGSQNICCVGDDDQSIYGWRGAEVENILRFEKDFEQAHVIRLERNYRSTTSILATASSLISYNKGRLGKTLFPHHEGGEKVAVVSLWDERAEAQYVATLIRDRHLMDAQQRYDKFAVLVRAGFQTREFEEAFLSLGIPYQVIGGLRFYERMEIRDALAYIRATVAPSNDLALERIINLPKRGVGGSTLDSIRDHARRQNIPLCKAIRELIEQNALKPRMKTVLSELLENFARWESLFATEPHAEVVDRILKESGYMNMWKAQKTTEAEGRVENLRELVSALEDFESIEQFLEHVSLVADGDDAKDTNVVSIMTMHGAKGLEFDTVFLTGWEEGLFPSQRSMDEKGEKGLEEERRLAYVGVTRARKHLTISYAANRRVYGQWMSSIPSRFVDELPPEHIQVINGLAPTASRTPMRQSYGKPSFGRSSGGMQERSITNFRAASNAKFKIGERIFHQKFGYGSIRAIENHHLTIQFEKAGVKTVLDDYVEKM